MVFSYVGIVADCHFIHHIKLLYRLRIAFSFKTFNENAFTLVFYVVKIFFECACNFELRTVYYVAVVQSAHVKEIRNVYQCNHNDASPRKNRDRRAP